MFAAFFDAAQGPRQRSDSYRRRTPESEEKKEWRRTSRNLTRTTSRDEEDQVDTIDDDSEPQKKTKSSRPRTGRKVSGSSGTKSRRTDQVRTRRDRSSEQIEPAPRRPSSPITSKPAIPKPTINMAGLVPEMERRPSVTSPATSRYPSLSKQHAKEAIGSRENIVLPRVAVFTPDPTNTDLGSRKATPNRVPASAATAGTAPPSPPLTAAEEMGSFRSQSGNSMRKTPEPLDLEASRPTSFEGLRTRATRSGSGTGTPKRAVSGSSHRKAGSTDYVKAFGELRPGPRHVASDGRLSAKVEPKSSPRYTSLQPEFSIISEANSASTTRSLSPKKSVKKSSSRPRPVAAVLVNESTISADDSSPHTPTTNNVVFPPNVKQRIYAGLPPPPPFAAIPSSQPVSVIDMSAGAPPPPPPPPPPAIAPLEAPKVDYLLMNGGLSRVAPRSLLAAIQPAHGAGQISTEYDTPSNHLVNALFSPFLHVLDDYMKVIEKNGSLAVATGYRSVARRLLDRLEAVFNRNISSEACDCVMCHSGRPIDDEYDDEEHELEEVDTGVSWGEILEYVSGRRDLPSWPPFTITTETLEQKPSLDAPFTKLDIDVPPEYRDHYIKQGKKTKQTVQNWLRQQPDMPSSPPQEIDDETLTFTMVTHLEPENRRLFTALIRGLSTIPQTRAPTPINTITPELMTKTALALQRLYRLSSPPRDPESAMYLLKYPGLHNVLATLAAISAGEWDILTSGRFDGFLWSGAENGGPNNAGSHAASHPYYRGSTPAQVQNVPPRTSYDEGSNVTARGGTPAALPYTPPGVSSTPLSFDSPRRDRFGAPVQMDEDTEVAVLAEMEREIYNGMEALEDAFEALHTKAEVVRSLLRARGAGLSIAASARRGEAYGLHDGPVATTGTPFSQADNWSPGIGGPSGLSADDLANWRAANMQDEDWFAPHAGRSELAPDDSASNISHHRRRRKKNREKDKAAREEERVRRTPAPVEEEDEDEDGEV